MVGQGTTDGGEGQDTAVLDNETALMAVTAATPTSGRECGVVVKRKEERRTMHRRIDKEGQDAADAWTECQCA